MGKRGNMKIPIIDLHADTYSKKHTFEASYVSNYCYYKDSNGKFKKMSEAFMITDDRLKKGNVKVQTQSLYLGTSALTNALHSSMKMISMMYKDIEKNDDLFLVKSAKDVLDNIENDKTGMFISIEGLELLERDLDLLDIFYELGVKLVAPSWNRITQYAGSIMEGAGIFLQGKELAKKINKKNMILDVSHLSEKSFFDFEKIITSPIIASHSNIKSLNNHIRNLSDDQLKVLHERDGIFGINFAYDFIKMNGVNGTTEGFELIYRIMEYAAENFSIDMVAFGSDFDGIGKAPEGLENPTCFPKLAKFLIKKGVSVSDIEKVFYKNALRIISKVC